MLKVRSFKPTQQTLIISKKLALDIISENLRNNYQRDKLAREIHLSDGTFARNEIGEDAMYLDINTNGIVNSYQMMRMDLFTI